MTPTLPELLTGVLAAFAEPPPPESAGDFMAGKIGVIGMITLLGAQEAEHGIAARVEENRLITDALRRAAPAWDRKLGGVLAQAAEQPEPELTLTALDARNAELRRALITLHTAADAEPTAHVLQGELLRLLARMAELRALHLQPMPPRA